MNASDGEKLQVLPARPPATIDDLPAPTVGRILCNKEREKVILAHLQWLAGPQYAADVSEAPLALFLTAHRKRLAARRTVSRSYYSKTI